MARVLIWYTEQLKRHPFLANGLTSGVISGTADICAQVYRYRYVEHAKHEALVAAAAAEGKTVVPVMKSRANEPISESLRAVNLNRSAILTSYSLLIGVPFWLNVYKVADWLWGGRKLTIPLAMAKGFTTWWFGFLSTPLFFTYNTTMEAILLDGDTNIVAALSESVAKMRRELLTVCTYGLGFWSVHWIPMFYLLPPHYRLLYASNVTLVWSSIMSYILHKGSKH